MRTMSTLRVLGALTLLLAGVGAARAAEVDDPGLTAVWQLEDDYWRYVKAGDVESYVKLWHDDFIGWPCGQVQPKRKDSIGEWVRNVRDNRISVQYELTREGGQRFGDVAVVHYSFSRVDTYPDGRVEGRGKRSKITHTWMKSGGTWLIIGGMCGNVADTAT